MTTFTFKDDITIDFGEGLVFHVPDSSEFVSDTLAKINENLLQSINKNPGDDRAALNSLLDAIDAILGDGATGRIFDGHTLSPRNVTGAYTFIIDEILSQYKEYETTLKDFAEHHKPKIKVGITDEAKADAAIKAAEQLGVLSVIPSDRPRL